MRAKPIRLISEGNKRLALVPLGRKRTKEGERLWTREATIYLEDYERLLDMGISPNWSCISKGYVIFPKKDKTVLVARALLNASDDVYVCYKDKNPLNLRRDNLFIKELSAE